MPHAPSVPQGYRIRARRGDDDPSLLRIENRAAELFRDHGYPAAADNPLAGIEDLRAMMAGQRVWVAEEIGGGPVGFAVAGPVGGHLHLRELSVDPAHGRGGVGAALVRAVIGAGQEAGLEGVSLTTFRSVPFNRPFYERLGFAELSLAVAPEALREAFRHELPVGVAAVERVLMVRLSAPPAGT